MHIYFRLFIRLFIPFSALFMFISTLYFQTEYHFTNAMRLGIIYGFFLAIVVSFFTALFLLILRQTKQTKEDIFSGIRTEKKTLTQSSNILTSNKTRYTNMTEVKPLDISLTTQKKIMLLMDKIIAFEVLLYAIVDQNLGQLTESKESKGYVMLKTTTSLMKIMVTPLTRHTSQIQIDSEGNDTQSMQNIISYIKKKEYSFTQYQ